MVLLGARNAPYPPPYIVGTTQPHREGTHDR